MWDDILKALRLFPDAVLTWVDEHGYPVSVRIQPNPDDTAQLLRVVAPAGMALRSGPASMLAHSHDAQLWSMKAFLVRGLLEQDDNGWFLRPVVFIPGAGISGAINEVKSFFGMRASAKRYLERRGLSRPFVPWDKIKSTY
jgi:hypothetical protein